MELQVMPDQPQGTCPAKPEGRSGKKRSRKLYVVTAVVTALILTLSLYAGSYVRRSSRGRYEPAAIGLNGVKWYEWAPEGFVTDYRWDASMKRIYWPLWHLDRRIWHTPDMAEGGKYPVNEVDPKDIGKVYKAWK